MNDIEVLEKELRNINNLIEYYTFENLDYDKKYRMEDFKKAIENLLKERQSDKERIKKVEENLKIATAMLTKGIYPSSNEEDNNFEKQFIPNSLIKEKIEELKKMKLDDIFGSMRDYAVLILEELLNGKM